MGRRLIGISGSLIWSKTLMELIFNPCDEFRWSPEDPAIQNHSPHLHDGASGIFSDILGSVQMLKREWGAESIGKLSYLFIPSKITTLLLEFVVEDLLCHMVKKNLMELIFNPYDEFWWSPKGPVSQIYSPDLAGAPDIFLDLVRSVTTLKREWRAESNAKLPHLFSPIMFFTRLTSWESACKIIARFETSLDSIPFPPL